MRNLIIIGNGFDKAHNLKTSYDEFLENMFSDFSSKWNTTHKGIIASGGYYAKTYASLKEFSSVITFLNGFIKKIIQEDMAKNWCDIEQLYFKELMLCDNKKSPKKLNEDFEVVKKHLSDYLKEEEKKAQKLDSYEALFELFCVSDDTLILNFNYTRIVESLYSKVIKCPIIHIHGELENDDNPIIFGYAANHKESRDLLSKNDNEYMRNVKKHLYKRTNNHSKLIGFLDKYGGRANIYEQIDVFFLGHSCGLSDKLILNEILNNKDIYAIRRFYYNDYKDYFEGTVNIDRIMENDERFKELIITFPDSHRMPQFSDDSTQTQSFKNYIESVRMQYTLRTLLSK